MGWKKIAESNDLIVFEKQMKDSKLKIEARKNDEAGWEVFKTKIKGETSALLSEYVLENKSEVKELITRLKKDIKLANAAESSYRKGKISLSRIFKEDFFEKWNFTVDDEKHKNLFMVKFDENLTADIVMHERYRPLQKSIISQLEDKLGLKEIGQSRSYDVYYFTKHSNAVNASKNELNMSMIDIEFGFTDDDSFNQA